MGSAEQVSEAHTVHHRAEDLDVLASEAAHPEGQPWLPAALELSLGHR